MKASLKQAWIAALRSGEYTQAKSRLVKGNSEIGLRHCCLGVLCELHPDVVRATSCRSIGNSFWASDEGFLYKDSFAAIGLPGDLPGDLGFEGDIVWLDGLKDSNGSGRSLAGLNDDGFTFTQIADIIEHFIPSEPTE